MLSSFLAINTLSQIVDIFDSVCYSMSMLPQLARLTETTAKDCKVAGGKFELPKKDKAAEKKA